MILTISIPTYNRAQELEALLEEILLQVRAVPVGTIDVLVSDNASTDGTREMVGSMAAKFAKCSVVLKYICNETNIGFSRNVINAVGNADGEYVLIMGDDDSLEPHTLPFLLGAFKRHSDGDLFFLNAIEYTSDLSRRVSPVATEDVDDELVYGDGVEYIYSKRGYPSALVSGYIVRKSAWLTGTPDDFAYSISVHMLTAGRLLMRHSVAVELTRPCIKYRGGQQNTTWSRDELYPFRFYLDSLMAAKIMDAEADRRALKILKRLSLRTIAFYLLRQKVVGHPFAKKLFADYYRRALGHPSLYSMAIALIRMMPAFVVRMFLGGWVKKVNERTGFQWKGTKNENQ